jgi:predicted cupin superfamily sugar epimerase
MKAEDIIKVLDLVPLEGEGGYYRETYKSPNRFTNTALPQGSSGAHSLSTCIYYLITPDSFSGMHRLPTDEIWHFYMGDIAEQIQILPNGEIKIITMGTQILAGEVPQLIVPANAWQSTRLAAGGKFALFGTTMSPGFEFSDYRAANKELLIQQYPAHKDLISGFFHQ